jgi:hypothetical protein
MIFESKLDAGCIFLSKTFVTRLVLFLALNIGGPAVSDLCLVNLWTYVW